MSVTVAALVGIATLNPPYELKPRICVGWVEQRETHRFQGVAAMAGIATLNPPYKLKPRMAMAGIAPLNPPYKPKRRIATRAPRPSHLGGEGLQIGRLAQAQRLRLGRDALDHAG